MMGWKCPGCSRCYSPNTSICGYCGPTNLPAPYIPNVPPSLPFSYQIWVQPYTFSTTGANPTGYIYTDALGYIKTT